MYAGEQLFLVCLRLTPLHIPPALLSVGSSDSPPLIYICKYICGVFFLNAPPVGSLSSLVVDSANSRSKYIFIIIMNLSPAWRISLELSQVAHLVRYPAAMHFTRVCLLWYRSVPHFGGEAPPIWCVHAFV